MRIFLELICRYILTIIVFIPLTCIREGDTDIVDAFQTSVFISGELYFNLIIIYFYLELKKVNFNFSSVPKMQLMSTGGLCLIIWFNFYLFLPYYEILIVHCLLIVPIVLLIYDIMRMLLKRLFK